MAQSTFRSKIFQNTRDSKHFLTIRLPFDTVLFPDRWISKKLVKLVSLVKLDRLMSQFIS